VERLLYRLAGIDPEEDQHWTQYAASMLLFSIVSMLLTYAVLRLHHLCRSTPTRRERIASRALTSPGEGM
jgi:potassium-transporting ATPase potassium-binding subunit